MKRELLGPSPSANSVVWSIVVLSLVGMCAAFVIGIGVGINVNDSQVSATGAPSGNAGSGEAAVTTPVAPPAPTVNYGDVLSASGAITVGDLAVAPTYDDTLTVHTGTIPHVQLVSGPGTHWLCWMPKDDVNRIKCDEVRDPSGAGTFETLTGHPEHYGFATSATRVTRFRDLQFQDGDTHTIQGSIPKASGGPLR